MADVRCHNNLWTNAPDQNPPDRVTAINNNRPGNRFFRRTINFAAAAVAKSARSRNRKRAAAAKAMSPCGSAEKTEEKRVAGVPDLVLGSRRRQLSNRRRPPVKIDVTDGLSNWNRKGR
jgi:hypothetical protein